MIGMGPEALLLKSRIDPRAELAEYARLEYPRAEVLAVEARIRSELENLPGKRSIAGRLLGWRRKRSPVGDVLLASGPALWRKRAGSPLELRGLEDAPLAAMPAIRGRGPPAGAPSSIPEALVLARESP
jgi:hypothetical protein